MSNAAQNLEFMIEKLNNSPSQGEFISDLQLFLTHFSANGTEFEMLERSILLNKPEKQTYLRFSMWWLQKNENIYGISLANNLIIERNFVAAFLIAIESFEIAKNDGNFIVDASYALASAAAALGMQGVVIKTLQYLNDVELTRGSINDRKSNWIIDIVNSLGMNLKKSEFPNLPD